eukprot:7310539-Lingulodinium_polyedra.AAC.1
MADTAVQAARDHPPPLAALPGATKALSHSMINATALAITGSANLYRPGRRATPGDPLADVAFASLLVA